MIRRIKEGRAFGSYVKDKALDMISDDLSEHLSDIIDDGNKITEYGKNVGTVIRETFYNTIHEEMEIPEDKKSVIFNKFMKGFKGSL